MSDPTKELDRQRHQAQHSQQMHPEPATAKEWHVRLDSSGSIRDISNAPQREPQAQTGAQQREAEAGRTHTELRARDQHEQRKEEAQAYSDVGEKAQKLAELREQGAPVKEPQQRSDLQPQISELKAQISMPRDVTQAHQYEAHAADSLLVLGAATASVAMKAAGQGLDCLKQMAGQALESIKASQKSGPEQGQEGGLKEIRLQDVMQENQQRSQQQQSEQAQREQQKQQQQR
jgi:hypothetical protein